MSRNRGWVFGSRSGLRDIHKRLQRRLIIDPFDHLTDGPTRYYLKLYIAWPSRSYASMSAEVNSYQNSTESDYCGSKHKLPSEKLRSKT